MDNLEPITRNEMFLNGDDLEPITREEMILAGADLEPITRHEWFLKKYRGGGGGGEYDLVNIPNLPADIASFNDGTDLPMASLKVAVTPYQDLSHGDPSPDNICPIIGWDEAVVTVADDAESPTTSHEYTIDLNGTRYGGVVDATNGTMTVDRVLNTIDQNSSIQFRSTGRALTFINEPYKTVTMGGFNVICDKLKSAYYANYDLAQNGEIATVSGSTAQTGISFKISDDITSLEELKTWLASNPLTIVTNLATPITVQLAPTAIKSIEGENNISANCGQITEVKYFKKA